MLIEKEEDKSKVPLFVFLLNDQLLYKNRNELKRSASIDIESFLSKNGLNKYPFIKVMAIHFTLTSS